MYSPKRCTPFSIESLISPASHVPTQGRLPHTLHPQTLPHPLLYNEYMMLAGGFHPYLMPDSLPSGRPMDASYRGGASSPSDLSRPEHSPTSGHDSPSHNLSYEEHNNTAVDLSPTIRDHQQAHLTTTTADEGPGWKPRHRGKMPESGDGSDGKYSAGIVDRDCVAHLDDSNDSEYHQKPDGREEDHLWIKDYGKSGSR